MKHYKTYLILVILIFLLSACTGTTAPTAPLFVIAGIEANKLLVFQDRALDGIAEGEPRFLKFTEAPLAARPIAFDSVEENSSRSELVVLSRGQTRNPETQVFPAYLNFFNTRGLTPDTPDTFRSSRAQIDLASFTTYPFPLVDLCPIDLEVTSDGSYAILFNSPRVCDSTKLDIDNDIVVISLKATPLTIASSLTLNNNTNPLVTSSIITGNQIPTGMYLDPSSNTLFYLRRTGNTAKLQRLELSAYTSTTPETTTNNQPVLENVVTINEFRDIAKVGSSIAILGERDYLLAPQSFTPNFVADKIDTVVSRPQNPRAFVQDPTGTGLLILDSNEELIYHTDPTNTTNTRTEIDGTVSTWNTTNDFLYIAGSNAQNQGFFNIIDTLPFDEGNTNLSQLRDEETCQESPDICEMVNPTALSWAEGILLPEAEQ